MTDLEELHRRAYESLDREDNFNYGEDATIHWQPVAKSEKDIEFEKQMAKLKAMKAFNNRGR